VTNFFLLIIDIWVLSGLVLLLHYFTPRFGFVPLLLLIGGLIVLTQSQTGIFIEPLSGFVLFLSSNVFIPVILMTVLVLYIANGAVTARIVIFSLLGLTVLSALVLLMYRLHLHLPTGGTFSPIPIGLLAPPLNLQITFASVVALAADMFGIAVVYQGAKNVAPKAPDWFIVGLALLAALWTDAIVFSILSARNPNELVTYLPGDVVGKTISALILWPIAAYYLTRVAPQMSGYQGAAGRSLFDVLSGSLEEIKLALVRTEKALHESEVERRQQDAYLREVIENIHEALWLAEPEEFRILYVNPTYERIWGVSATVLYAEPDTFIKSLHPEDRERIQNGLSQRLSEQYHVEFRIIRPDGTVRWVRDRTFPIPNDQGIIYRIVGLSEDITEPKQIEQDRLQLAIEREKVTLLRDFIGEFSHDLKTPLTAINLKIYHLARTDDAEKRKRHLDELAQQTGRMNEMIDNLLTLARLENLGDINRARVNINQIIADICQALRPQFEDKAVELILDLNRDAPPVSAAPDDLSRVFANLIENALHYTPKGGVVRIVTGIKAEKAMIQVSDTGIGIAEDDQPYIFDRFYRAKNARATDPGGTGLGLVIVKKIVEQHQGAIEVYSAVGSGTTFNVYLPLDDSFSVS
jgi:PAS domain S-box-containing protein